MIDLHTHILPQIDDGASNVDTALKMTEALYADHIQKAVCTPHYDPSSTSLEDFVKKRTLALSMMGASLVQLIPASETIFHEYLFHYNDLSELCIENTRYLLLELQDQNKCDQVFFENLSKLINYYDVIPIVAHIERYHFVKRKQIRTMLQMGCLLQMNSDAILNKKTRNKALRYLKNGYISVIGSDCHDLQKRPPNLSTAIELIKSELGASYIERLEYHGDCVVNGTRFLKKKSYIIE